MSSIVPQTSLANAIPQLPDPNKTNYNLAGGKYFFSRSWTIQIGVPGQTGWYYPMQTIDYGTGQITTNLRLVADIQKTAISSSNKAKIQVYNFDAAQRSKYFKGMQLVVQAGYGTRVQTMFVGNITQRVLTERKGADVITSFECGDGEEGILMTKLNKSYPAGSTNIQVINDLVTAMGLSLGVVSGLTAYTFNGGFVACGWAKRIMDNLMKKQGLEWSVQNGIVQIIPIGSGNGSQAVLVNQATGLIGVPTQGNGGDNITTFSSLLNPLLYPGAIAQLQSAQFSGFYQVRNAHIELDSHGPKWQVTCECSSGTVTPPANQNIGGSIAA